MLPDPLARALTERLAALYGERLYDVLLFGSHARCEAHSDGDVDVMIVMAGAVDRVAESWRLVALRLDLMHEAGESPRSDGGTHHLFYERFALSGLIDREHARTLSVLYQQRQDADYDSRTVFRTEDARTAIERATALLHPVTTHLGG